MNRANRIRIFFCVLAVLCCGAYYAGYQYTLQMEQKKSDMTTSKSTDRPYSNMETEKEQTDSVPDEKSVASTSELAGFSYAIVEEDGFLTVYEKDLRTVFLYTGIPFESLPDDLKDEIRQGKLFQNDRDLYIFLENYSS